MERKKYTGKLSKKLILAGYPKRSLLDKEEEYNEKYNKKRLADFETIIINHKERTKDLFHFFDIEYGNWERLAMALAYNHVPAFQFKMESKKKGRKKEWESMKLLGLYLDFELKRKELKIKYPKSPRSDSAIARMLSKNEWVGTSSKVLLNEYALSKKSLFIKMIQMAKPHNSNLINNPESIVEIFIKDYPNLIKVSRKLK